MQIGERVSECASATRSRFHAVCVHYFRLHSDRKPRLGSAIAANDSTPCNEENTGRPRASRSYGKEGRFKQSGGVGGQRSLRVSPPLIMIERRVGRHRCFGGKSKVARVAAAAAVLKPPMRLGRSIVTLERFLVEIKTRRGRERGRALGFDLLCPLNAEIEDHLPPPPPSTYPIEEEVLVRARGKGKADEKITCISLAHDFQTSKGRY